MRQGLKLWFYCEESSIYFNQSAHIVLEKCLIIKDAELSEKQVNISYCEENVL